MTGVGEAECSWRAAATRPAPTGDGGGAMNPQEVDVRSRPEGPFESADLRYSRGVSGEELVRFLDFVDAFGSEADQVLSLRRGYDETRMLTTLLRNHLTGKLTTTSLLADSSRGSATAPPSGQSGPSRSVAC